MKRILFLAIVWIALCYTTKAQEENVFPTNNAIWNIYIEGDRYIYGLKGDTIINDTLYNKLYLLNDTILKLYTITGQMILEKKFQSNMETVPFSKKGIYIYQIIKNGEVIKTDKLIIK